MDELYYVPKIPQNSKQIFSFNNCSEHDFIILFSFITISKRHTLRSETICDSWKPFKSDEKCFLFHLNGFISSQDVQVYALTFGSCSKTA